MKTMINSFKVILSCVLLLSSGLQVRAGGEVSKVIHKEYNVKPDARLIIDNKFGQVHCNNWDKNTISIDIKITIEASDENEAEKLMDMISIKTDGSPSQVEARTIISEHGFTGMKKTNINYTINMPESVNLDIANKFGNIYINELSGKAKINLSYGNLEVNRLDNSDNLIDIKFSKATIQSVKGAVLMLNYSELNLTYAGSLRLDSRYSNLHADKVIALNGNFEGGKLDMMNSSAIDSKTRFSDISVSRLEKSLNLDIQYGNCDIGEMPADFSSVTIKNSYANISVRISDAASYQLEAKLKFCELEFPESSAILSQKTVTNTSKSYQGTIGENTAPVAKVNVTSEYGNVSLK